MQIKFLHDEFCIRHQKMVEKAQLSDGSVGHVAALFAPDWGWCEGPFASCPPPEVGLTFEEVDQLVPPSEDELIQMDMNAEVLEQDFLSGGADMKELESYDKVILNLFDRFYDEQN